MRKIPDKKIKKTNTKTKKTRVLKHFNFPSRPPTRGSGERRFIATGYGPV